MLFSRRHRAKYRNDLLDILVQTKNYIDASEESFYAGFSPIEIGMDLSLAIEALNNGLKVDVDQLRMHFGPTGPLQETAMESGWVEEYLRLAESFDGVIKKV